MLIKSLTLNNFRQFTGEQTITFSTDKNQKVTFVMAESGVGKTTLIQSFQWVLYGTSKFSKILNGVVEKNMFPGNSESVTGKLVINHGGRDYIIFRKQVFYKANVSVRAEDSIVNVEYKDDEGISKQVRGREAEAIIKRIMHRDLFPYFFLEGESLTKVGEQMARGKASSNNDFVKAIKGLLGFNFLYEEKKHLKTAVDEYDVEIARCTSNDKLSSVIEEIKKYSQNINAKEERIEHINEDVSHFEEKRNELQDRLIEIGEIASDQQRAKSLSLELPTLQEAIYRKQKALFDKFSSSGFYFVANSLLNDAREVLKNSDSMDKGIPGMNVDAINYMLKNHKCICGEELVEGSEHWKMLNDLLNYLPPNNIGIELKTFSNEMKQIERQSDYFNQDFINFRKDLQESIKNYDNKVDEYNELNEKIGGVSEDVGALKKKEQEYNLSIANLNAEKKRCEDDIASFRAKINELNQQKENYQKLDERTQKLQQYRHEADFLRRRVERYIETREKEKKVQLSTNINEIFKDFYQDQITFTLDSDYGVHIQTFNKELSDDFTSGGQDVAVALAFIGAIIKVNGEKDAKDDEAMDDGEEDKESYPLVMDAPTSNFGMKQMKNFSEIMPKIADQIIVFINDKDGPILKKLLDSEIGETWSLHKEEGDSYHTRIEKGVQ